MSGEAFGIADEHVDDPELDALFTELLRVHSEHTERMEADPAVTGFVADVVAPAARKRSPGMAPRTDGMGNLLWQVRRCVSVGSGPGPALHGLRHDLSRRARCRSRSRARSCRESPMDFKGPCIWGRGGCEQKAALAAMLTAAAAAVRRSGQELARPLLLATR